MLSPLRRSHNVTSLARRFYSVSLDNASAQSGANKAHLFWRFIPEENRTYDVILGTPSQVAYYSRHSATEIRYDASMLRQLKRLDATDVKAMDLRAMFAEYAAQRDENPFFQEEFYAQNKQSYQLHNLDDMLAACLWHGTPSSWRQADVIAPDSAMMGLFFGRGVFNVSYVQGKLYLFLHLDHPVKKQPDLNRYCADNRYFTSVIKRNLGGLNLLTSSRIRAIHGDFANDTNCYVYPHCKDIAVSPAGLQRLKKDYKKWHVHCLLLGIRTVLYGRREGHVLSTLSVLDSSDLAHMAFIEKQTWNVMSVFNHGFTLLCSLREYLQRQVDERAYANPLNNEDRIWRVQLQAGRPPTGFHCREIYKGTADWVELMGCDDGSRIGIVPKQLWHDLLTKSRSLLHNVNTR
ncbi:hypothetical protein BDZ89DRAFT_1067979 [Hymenopellis radicata]|nr:hypothetical protein BDZ89DRAFT_1067979 [Hymenopellis radicata]